VTTTAKTGDPHSTSLAREAVILASSSATRRTMLERAGLAVEVDPPRTDEEEIKRSMRAGGFDAAATAEALAEQKARGVARRHAGTLVLGADQILECDGKSFDKPKDLDAARDQLHELSARRHELVSAACIVQDGERLWHVVDRARLWIRPLGEEFIEGYLRAIGDAAFAGPGSYQVEGLGAQLFQRVEGDHFTILGLPLLPLLDFLRARGVLLA
jgi:septum formation protein